MKMEQTATHQEEAAEHADAEAEEVAAEAAETEALEEIEAEHLLHRLFFSNTGGMKGSPFFSVTVKAPTSNSSSRPLECSMSTSTRHLHIRKTLHPSAEPSRL
jgi:hypothetical protein